MRSIKNVPIYGTNDSRGAFGAFLRCCDYLRGVGAIEKSEPKKSVLSALEAGGKKAFVSDKKVFVCEANEKGKGNYFFVCDDYRAGKSCIVVQRWCQ